MKKFITFLISAILFTSCVEKYDLEFAKVSPRLVVEGVITNENGPYYIRLTESHIGKHSDTIRTFWIDNLIPVRDALIIITDNVNQIDTLTYVDHVVDFGGWRFDYLTFRGYYRLEIDHSSGNVVDTIWMSDPPSFGNNRGFYKTQNLVGIPGRTYSLKIIWQNKEYRAEAYMPPVPEIDSLGVMMMPGLPGKHDNYRVLLYFYEPQETKDYYLTRTTHENMIRGSGGSFEYISSVFSDEFLQPYVNGLAIGNYGSLRGDELFYVKLSSLTREAFLYYQALMRQFESDGGTFSPAPATPPTNISNGALGFFRASAVSEKSIYINVDNLSPSIFLTSEVTEITATTAVSGGEIYDVHHHNKGICWSTNPNPTINDFSIRDTTWDSDFSLTMTNLTPNTKYYVRAYVIDSYGMVHYGTQVEFTTLAE